MKDLADDVLGSSARLYVREIRYSSTFKGKQVVDAFEYIYEKSRCRKKNDSPMNGENRFCS